MTIVVCPHCQSEIALTESVLAPVLEAIRCEYQQRLALKDAEVASCQAALQAR